MVRLEDSYQRAEGSFDRGHVTIGDKDNSDGTMKFVAEMFEKSLGSEYDICTMGC